MENTQRQIKFRAWDKRNNEWLSATGIAFAIDGQVLYRGLATNWYTLEQFTGLLDKNGKEIYEGDILRDVSKDNGANFAAALRRGNYQAVWSTPDAAFALDGYIHPFVDQIVARLEVIGNIHENPDLLTTPYS